MDSPTWKTTIVNWINCLSVRNTFVSDFADLENGDVFFNLICAFTNDRTPLEQNETVNVISHVKSFIKETYPDFTLKSPSSNTFIPEDCVYISALLLHYCVIRLNDTNTPFKNLMISLDETCQIDIYKYLQNVMQHNALTREMIALSIPIETDMHFDSPSLSLSPCTPNQQKYSGQLQRVQEDLKTKLSEIFYLEESLKDLTEKYNELASEKERHLSEIKKLKENLEELDRENKSPKKNVDTTDVLTQVTKLKSEIQSKNEEIEKLQLEIEHYEIEKHKMESKLEAMTTNIEMLESTAAELQLKNDRLQVSLDDRNLEVERMKEICGELNLTIEQLKDMNKKDKSMDELDMSFSNLPIEVQSRYMEETLAQTVVDVQLREKETEVDQLQEVLNDTKKELDKITKELNQLQQENEEWKNRNEKLEAKTAELEQDKSDL
ncbi:intracellular protein transport protein USO1-like, partial [Ctenocephalides felis]|uniref:intracellular protein transport protein USO1-like n=1 Tax=Ctenocephalides felis TaxID=7515 RepID=UPI000E6E40FB